MPANVSRVIRGPFALDESKLTRLLDVVASRTREVEAQWRTTFVVSLKNGKRVSFTDQDDVIALDNTKANPVSQLEIKFVGKDNDRMVSEGEVVFEDGTYAPVISLRVSAADGRWAQQVQAELEEQVERTRQTGLLSRLAATPSRLLFPMVMLLFLTLMTFAGMLADRSQGISVETRDSLLALGTAAATDSAKLAFLVESQVASLQAPGPDLRAWSVWLFRWQTLFIAGPLLLSVALGVYAILTCYPRSAFVWGDMKDHYEGLVTRRRIIWSICILSLFVGVIGNLAAAAILSLVG